MRCDANVSLRPAGRPELGTKVEIKNMNSFRNVQHALEYEIERQARALDDGRAHRPGDAALGSRPGADRLHALEGVRPRLPLLSRSPTCRRSRRRGGLGRRDPAHAARAAGRAPRGASPPSTVSRRTRPSFSPRGGGLADYFEDAARAYDKPKIVANWVLNELLREVPGDDDRAIAACPIPPENLAGLLR